MNFAILAPDSLSPLRPVLDSSLRVLPVWPEPLGNSVASWGFYDVLGATDISTFRNHLPLTKASQAQEEESGGQPLPPTSNRYHGEASLQVNGE